MFDTLKHDVAIGSNPSYLGETSKTCYKLWKPGRKESKHSEDPRWEQRHSFSDNEPTPWTCALIFTLSVQKSSTDIIEKSENHATPVFKPQKQDWTFSKRIWQTWKSYQKHRINRFPNFSTIEWNCVQDAKTKWARQKTDYPPKSIRYWTKSWKLC